MSELEDTKFGNRTLIFETGVNSPLERFAKNCGKFFIAPGIHVWRLNVFLPDNALIPPRVPIQQDIGGMMGAFWRGLLTVVGFSSTGTTTNVSSASLAERLGKVSGWSWTQNQSKRL